MTDGEAGRETERRVETDGREADRRTVETSREAESWVERQTDGLSRPLESQRDG